MNDELLATIRRREEVLEKVKGILIRNLGVRRRPEEIDPDTPLFGTGLGLDSVDAVELVVAAEAEFGLRIPDGPYSRIGMRTLNTLVDLLLALSDGAFDG
jgi:acyl carrier protein